MARILFDHVTKYYGSVKAVNDLTLEIQDKEFLVLLGPSGCGKTTTLNMIAGLEELSEGDIYFDQQIVNFMPPHKRDVAMVFQSYALYPHKSVYENIAFGLRMRRHDKSDIDRLVRDAAARLEIAHLLDRRPQQLSGGQRQRVALGRAMVRNPAVFLMDEPLSNLDAALRISMRAEIKALYKSMQTTFVYVTHDQAEALTLADRIVVMRDGRVQQIGTPTAIYEQPENMFVASFLGNPPINYLEGVIEADAHQVAFQRGMLKLPFNEELAALMRPFSGREVVLGIRPEDVDESNAETGGALRLSGQVRSVLPVGSDQYLGMRVEGADLFFRVSKDVQHRDDENLTLTLKPKRLHLFDRRSQQRLLQEQSA
ncbi:MAG: ABC transporter ATP-binding protein [Candidatus Competibacteraceae bacterium]|nr:ABC transporter ATP-binding protein [Candidatus Competibacteraceae bacterium]MCB1805093.1 ABC transporter ATP-binding protein [Candidatus Competibacteraceae bacterium]MCB1810312.1 ABC transporter ATP-binding protein [Candidatus Competibacteraceae bacterium]